MITLSVGVIISRGEISSLCQKLCHHPAQINREKVRREKFSSHPKNFRHSPATFFALRRHSIYRNSDFMCLILLLKKSSRNSSIARLRELTVSIQYVYIVPVQECCISHRSFFTPPLIGIIFKGRRSKGRR